jgi:flavin-dependent dehydrogenase
VTLETDAVVIGAGPAGAACAHALAAARLQVAVIERTTDESRRVGELLPPEIAGPLHAMGAWQRFTVDGHRRSYRTLSCWGDEHLRHHDHLCHPFGTAWTVNRGRFDRLLVDVAVGAGAQVYLGTCARRCWQEDGQWRIHGTNEHGVMQFRARYLVDATGRTRGLRSGRRRGVDRLVACVSFLDRSAVHAEAGECPSIEAAPNGWWYINRLPDDRAVLAFMTDADLLPCGHDAAIAHFRKCLRGTLLIGRWVPPSAPIDSLYRCAADSYWWPSADENRIAVGDAMMSADPLSGTGVLHALNSGRAGAEAIVVAEYGHREALASYGADLRSRFNEYLAIRTSQYRFEQRWSSQPFWLRRHH